MMLDVLEWDAKVGDYRPVQKPKLQPSCYTPAAEGMEILSDSSYHVVKARKDVQEFLLLNHPVDCPICDQSGECKLQDYWLEHGQYQKRMRDEPVHKPKGVVFGPTIVYDARALRHVHAVRPLHGGGREGPGARHARARQPERDHGRPGPRARRPLHVHDRARVPGRRAHDAGLPLQGARLVSAHGARRVPGVRDGVQRAPRLRPSLQQGLSIPAARQREGQQVLDVRRGDAHVQGGARGARPRPEGPRHGDLEREGARRGEEALRGGPQGGDRRGALRAARPRRQLGAPRARARAHRDGEHLRERQAGGIRGRDPHPPRQEPQHQGRRAARTGSQAAAGAHRRRRRRPHLARPRARRRGSRRRGGAREGQGRHDRLARRDPRRRSRPSSCPPRRGPSTPGRT